MTWMLWTIYSRILIGRKQIAMKKYIESILILFLLLAVSAPVQSFAQGSKKKAKEEVLDIRAQVTDNEGKPIAGAMVYSAEGSVVNYTDENGYFRIKASAGEPLLVEAWGYVDVPVKAARLCPETIKMNVEELFASEKDEMERADGGNTYRRDFVGAVSSLDMDNVLKYPDLQLSNALQGQAAGLIAISGDGGIGYNTSTLYVRGQHNNGTNNAIVIIDGIERSIDDILPEEIESISVLKDATAKILYGAAATNGVVLIKTKRGEVNKRNFKVGLEYGVQPSTRVPEFLGAYDYATLFNEARVNDGMTPFYSQSQLEGYRNSTGVNDVLYPSVDYYDYFLLNQNTYRKATVEYNGGTEGVRYAVVAGYTGSSGLEKIGKRSDLNRMNLRGNLDIRITDFLTVTADVAARVEIKDWGALDGGGMFGYLSTNRPNEFPFIIPNETLAEYGFTPNEDGTPFFGGSTRVTANIYGEMTYGGSTSERYVNSQTNLGTKFDFNKYVKGLTFNAYVTFDNYSYLRQALRNTYPTYAVDTYTGLDGEPVIKYTQLKELNLPKTQNIQSNETYRYFGFNADLGYAREFGRHDVSAVAAFRYTKNESTGMTQDFKDANATLRLNYGYDGRYLAEVTFAGMGSNKFRKGSRFFFSPAVGAAWVISNESFLKGVSGVDFLKLKASYGILGYAGNTDFFLYRTGWNNNGDFNFRQDQIDRKVGLARWGNPDLKWERSEEVNVGIEGLFLDKRLSIAADWFYENRSDIIGINTARYAAVAGNYTIYENIGQVANSGVDLTIGWNGRAGRDFTYGVSMNMTYSKNRLLKWNELDGVESYRKSIGRPTSTVFGLDAIGLFGKDVALADHVLQSYGVVREGDIAYADLNGDDIVDDNDRMALGQTFPVTSWGITIDLKYKGFGLYVLGTAQTGITKMCTNSYYWNNGLNGYSVLAADRWHAEHNPDGTMPRLTTTTDSNNFRDSSFWARNASFFRLKNVELSYTFETRNSRSIVKNFKVFARGTNLLTVSRIKDLDPERLNAGLTNYPVYMTVTGGVSVSF